MLQNKKKYNQESNSLQNDLNDILKKANSLEALLTTKDSLNIAVRGIFNHISIKSEGSADEIDFDLISSLQVFFDKILMRIKDWLKKKPNEGLKNFYADLLRVQFEFMSLLLHTIPKEQFAEYKPMISTEPYNDPSQVIHVLNKMLEEKITLLMSTDEKDATPQLDFSNKVSLTSAVFSSAASFERQFVNNRHKCTLDDLRELMSLNCHAFILENNFSLQANEEKLNETQSNLLALIRTHVPEMRGNTFPPNILYVGKESEKLSIHYTIPLAFHAMDIMLQHDEEDKKLNVNMKFYGEPRDRLNLMKRISKSILQLLSAKVITEPKENEEQWLFETEFDVDASNPNAVEDCIKFIQLLARLSFNDRYIEAMTIIDAAKHSKASDEIASECLKYLLQLYSQARGRYLKHTHIQELEKYIDERDVPKEIAKYIIGLMLPRYQIDDIQTEDKLNSFLKLVKHKHEEDYMSALCNLRLGKYSFIECMILNGNDELASDLLKKNVIKPETNMTLVKTAFEKENWSMLVKLINKGFYSPLSEDQETKLKAMIPDTHAVYIGLKDQFPDAQSVGRGRNRRLPRRGGGRFGSQLKNSK